VRPQISQIHTLVVVVVVAAFRFARLLHNELVLSASKLATAVCQRERRELLCNGAVLISRGVMSHDPGDPDL